MTICELVIGDIQGRAELGMKRYGKPLERTGDLRGALLNAYEECLDQAIYLRQALESFQGMPEGRLFILAGEGTKMRQDERASLGSGLQRAKEEDLSCVKCGASCASRRSKAQHERWCGRPRVHRTEGPMLPMPPEVKHDLLCQGSSCCGAKVKIGEPHPMGNRYCGQCKEPCTWTKNGKLPPGSNKSFHCIGMKNCPRLTEYRDGYCLPCWQKRRPKRVSKEEKEIIDEIHAEDSPDEV